MKTKEQARQYYLDNRESILKKARDYHIRNRARDISRSKAYYHKPEVKAKQREKWLMKQYGITHIQYIEKYNKQEGKCAICGDFKPTLQVDHDHKTGKVRDLLCINCNNGILGGCDDNIAILENAIQYIKKHR